jgi:MoxR-like ATPase
MIKVMPGNYDRYTTKKHLIKGVGKTADTLILEITDPGEKYRYLVSVTPDLKVRHRCKAADEGRPCWHLAAALEIMARYKKYRQPYPASVESIAETPYPETVEDITPSVLPWKSDFQLLGTTDSLRVVKIELTGTEDETDEETDDEKEYETEHEAETRFDGELCGYSFPSELLRKLTEFRENQKEILSEEQLQRVPKTAGYIPAKHELLRAVGSLLAGPNGSKWEPIMLIGPRATGKSTLADTLGYILQLPVTRISGSSDLTADWLLGGPTISYVDGRQQITHQPGFLLQAVRDGNLLVFEEINMVLSEITSLLHPLLDWQRVLPVPGVGAIKPHPSFRFIACMNPGYAGTRQVNEAFESRFCPIKIPYPAEPTIVNIIVGETGIKKEIASRYASIFSMIIKRAENRDISEEAVSIRALIGAARDVADIGLSAKDAIRYRICDSLQDPYTASVVEEIIDSKIA